MSPGFFTLFPLWNAVELKFAKQSVCAKFNQVNCFNESFGAVCYPQYLFCRILSGAFLMTIYQTLVLFHSILESLKH